MRALNVLMIVAIAGILFHVSCSGGKNVVTPNLEDKSNFAGYDSLPVLISDFDKDGTPEAGWGVLGLFNLVGNPKTADVKLIPLRRTEFYDTLEVVDLTNFMKLSPCTNCAKVRSIELTSDGMLQVNISLNHPFAVGDPMKPITGRNRADLHVFNVEGLVMATQSTETPVTFTGLGQTVGNTHLVNADGYSSYLDGIIDGLFPTAATVHPYKLHFRDYSSGNFNPSNPTGFSDILHPTGNLVMAMGCDLDTQPYIFDLTGIDRLDFIYAVGCTYALSAKNKSSRFTPEYRIPQHNKKAASEVHVEIVQNSLRGGVSSSDCKLNVKVLDMNHGVAVGEGLDQMHAQSDVSAISVEVSGVTSAPVVLSSPTPLSGTPRDPANPLLYELTFTNSASAPMGTYTGLVKVLDNYQQGQNSAPSLNGMDGIGRVDPGTPPTNALFIIPEFATYAAFIVKVNPATELPVCQIVTIPANGHVFTNQNITFDGSLSHDPDGSIVSYEWDYDYNGTTFSPDATGAVVNTSYPAEGNFTAALRVTDDMTASTICTKDISVSLSTIPDDFVKIDGMDIGQNVTIVEDYNGLLHAFYGKPATSLTDLTSNIYWAYSTDHGNTWQGHLKIYETIPPPSDYFHVIAYPFAQMVNAHATAGPKIYLGWLEQQFFPADWQHRVVAGQFDISNLNAPTLTTIVVRTGVVHYLYPGVQITSTSDDRVMMYYMEYRGTGWFVPFWKFADFDNLDDLTGAPSMDFTLNTTNGFLIYVYNSTSPILAVDSQDNILFTLSGRFSSIGVPSPPYQPTPPPPFSPYDPGYGSAILRFNNSGNYSSGNNWTFVQHYGCVGSQYYWDNWTQALDIDKNDKVHWVFEYEIDGYPDSETHGVYSMVYGEGSPTGQWDFTYKDPIHLDMRTSDGSKILNEFRYVSIDTNSENEVWITYQRASDVPEIYYTYSGSPLTSWQTPTLITDHSPLDQAWYPYMFVSSWDAMYVVMSDAASNGYPWVRAINTL